MMEYSLADLPIEQTITVRQGAVYYQPFRVYLDGATLDLSNATIDFVVKDSSGNTVVSASLTSTDFDDASTGLFTIELDTSSVTAGEYSYEMWLTIAAGDARFPDGLKVCLLAGPFNVEASLL